MGIFDKFQSKDELLKAVEAAIQSQTVKTDGENGAPGKETEVFFLVNDTQGLADDYKAKYDAEVKNAQNMRKRAQTAESRVSELERENSILQLKNDEYSKSTPDRDKQTAKINELLEKVGNLNSDNKALAEQNAKMSKMVADFQTKENDRIIEKALIDEATKLGVRPEAMRDVMYRRSMLEVSDIGIVQTKDEGTPIGEFMKSEFDASPLWHPQSQGGGSNPGTGTGHPDSATLFKEAQKNRDVGGMFANAPEFKGATGFQTQQE